MTGKTHVIGGITAGAAAQYFLDMQPQDLIFLASCAGGALIPDICHSGSKLGRRMPLVSKTISTIFGHRKLTHSLVFLLLLAGVTSFFQIPQDIRTGILVGAVSHLILDAGTTRGIALLWPLSWKVRLPLRTNTGSAAEQVIAGLLLISSIWMTMQEFGLV